MTIKRIALYGERGAGKSTLGRLISEALGERCRVYHSAAPLYHLQAEFYKAAEVPLLAGQQDGELLQLIAKYLRLLRESTLADGVIRAAEQWEVALPDGYNGLLLCDDSVPADRAHLLAAGFEFVFVRASTHVRHTRRGLRGDIRADQDRNDPIVQPASHADLCIDNDGDVSELRAAALELVRLVLP